MTKRVILSKILHITGLVFAIAPPALAFLDRFPVMNEANYEKTVSWFAVLVIFLCLIPLWKNIKQWMTKTPDAVVMWLVFFLVFSIVKEIIDGMVIVAFFGMCGNIAAKLLFWGAKKLDGTNKKEIEE